MQLENTLSPSHTFASQQIKPEQQDELWQQEEHWQHAGTKCRAYNALASIQASGSELYIAAIDLFGSTFISQLHPGRVQHLIYQLRADVLVKTIFKRRIRTFLRWENTALNEFVEDWNLDTLAKRYLRRLFYTKTQLRPSAINNVWRLYAIILVHRRLEETPGWRATHPDYRQITCHTWLQYDETALLLAVEFAQPEHSFEGCQLLYNALLLRNRDLTLQFFNQVPSPRVAMLPEQLLHFTQQVSSLQKTDAIKFVQVFFYHLSVGRIFTTMYSDTAPTLASPNQLLHVNIPANAEPILESDICRTLAYN